MCLVKVRLGKLGWQVPHKLSSLGVGDVAMGSLGRLSFMRLVPGTGIWGKGGAKGIHVY